MFKAIWAEDLDGVIGDGNSIPWYVPEDFRRFKELTLFSPVVMGKNTWLSLPAKSKPLKDRTNVILSSTLKRDEVPDNVLLYNHINELEALQFDSPVVWIIGGASLYQQMLGRILVIERTVVHIHSGGNIKAPVLSNNDFRLEHKTNTIISENKGIKFHYETWVR